MKSTELMEKQNFVKDLGIVYKKATLGDIQYMQYLYEPGPVYDDFDREQVNYPEKVEIIYKSGMKKVVNESADILQGILCDVYKRLYQWGKQNEPS